MTKHCGRRWSTAMSSPTVWSMPGPGFVTPHHCSVPTSRVCATSSTRHARPTSSVLCSPAPSPHLRSAMGPRSPREIPLTGTMAGPTSSRASRRKTSSCNMPATKAYRQWRCAFPPPMVPGTGNRRRTADCWHSSRPADGPSTSRTGWRSSVSKMPHTR